MATLRPLNGGARQRRPSASIPIHYDPADSRRYEDFSTIDWVQDTLVERARRRKDAERSKRTIGKSIKATFWRAFDATQSWLVVSLVGKFCTFI
ncbi:BQ2448_3001 [Microbotryum intermedium]|uniref:BQ2448_3001 protein n=1 Tax=Microbotryum intermedium TaxID=269621 RepID=A0A238FHD2_9BASI|nr:BQ2448_3001 [Microbotryum intermedium]